MISITCTISVWRDYILYELEIFINWKQYITDKELKSESQKVIARCIQHNCFSRWLLRWKLYIYNLKTSAWKYDFFQLDGQWCRLAEFLKQNPFKYVLRKEELNYYMFITTCQKWKMLPPFDQQCTLNMTLIDILFHHSGKEPSYAYAKFNTMTS